MKNTKPTFNEILKQTGQTNSRKLMAKARLANRLAKMSRGRNRQNAYSVKAKALKFLVEKMPNNVSVRQDIKLTEFVIVELKNAQSGLHTPISNLQGI